MSLPRISLPLEGNCLAHVYHSPEDGAVEVRLVGGEIGRRFAEAAQHDDCVAGGGVADGLGQAGAIRGVGAVENVGQREGVEGMGGRGFQARGGVGLDETDFGQFRDGRNFGFAQEKPFGVRVCGVWMVSKSAFQALSQDGAEFRGKDREELRLIDRAEDYWGHQGVEGCAEAARIQMIAPERHLLGDVAEIQESMKSFSSPSYQRHEAAGEIHGSLGVACFGRRAGGAALRVGQLGWVYVTGYHFVGFGQLQCGVAGGGYAENAALALESCALDLYVFVHAAEEEAVWATPRMQSA